LNDAEFVQKVQQGDPHAWETLVDTYQQVVFRLAYLIVGDPDDAADVAQEAFIQFHRTLDRFDPARPVQPWLLKIAANLARNRLRSLGRYLKTAQRWFTQAGTGDLAPIEAQAAARMESEALWKVVRRLSGDDQAVIYLRYYLDLPVAETAAALDVAPGTVKSRLHRALGRLRAELRSHPELQKVLHEDF